MMDDSALKSLFERISSDSSLQNTLMEAIQPPTDATSNSKNTQPPGQTDQHTNNVNQVADEHLRDEPSLVADVHQSRGVNGRGAGVPSSSVNPPATEDLDEVDGTQPQERSVITQLPLIQLQWHQVMSSYLILMR